LQPIAAAALCKKHHEFLATTFSPFSASHAAFFDNYHFYCGYRMQFCGSAACNTVDKAGNNAASKMVIAENDSIFTIMDDRIFG
jgi:hypothetical protein